eukprot:scaffold25771_cov62-Phaeocystis_antarctica.AAC.2
MPRRGASATLRRRMGRRTAHGGGHRVRTGFLAARRGPRCLYEVSWHTVVCDCRVNAGAAGRTRLGLGWAWGEAGVVCGGRELECDVKPH